MTTTMRLAVVSLILSLILLPLFGCASRTAPAAQASTETFTGEVWTWDERENTVTLRRGAQDVRVKTTPDQIKGLQLHQTATIRGTLAPPAELPTTVAAPVAMTPVPRGPIERQTVNGTVTAVDPSGRLSIESPRGPLHVWAASGADRRFKAGDHVQVTMMAQAVDMVRAPSGAPTAVADPSASMSSQPGDSAVITGRVIGVDRGLLVVESPSGPIQIWVGDMPRYGVSQPVQVRTNVVKAQ